MLEIKNEADGTSGQYNAELWGMAAKGSCLVSRGYKVLCSPKYSYYIDPTEDQSTLWFGGHMISWKGTYSEGQSYVHPISKLQSINLTTLVLLQIYSRAIALCMLRLATISQVSKRHNRHYRNGLSFISLKAEALGLCELPSDDFMYYHQ